MKRSASLLSHFVIAGVLICGQQMTFAQDTPAGKRLAEEFWKFMQEGRVSAAEGRLGSLKRREPGLDVSKMEKALADAKGQREDNRSAARSALLGNVKASQHLDELFRARVIQADSSATLESIRAQIDRYAKLADEVVATDRTSIESNLQGALDSLKRELQNDREINVKLVNSVNNDTIAKNAETSYYELLLRQSYWDTARRIYPNEGEIRSAYDAVSASIKGLGTPDQRAARADKNRSAQIDAERMPKAGQNNPAMEKQFQDAFTAMNQAKGLNHVFLRAVVISPDFSIVRHNVTGVVLGRYLIGAIGFKDKDGKCKQARFRIDQNYAGNSFSGNWRGDFADFAHEMRCENVSQ